MQEIFFFLENRPLSSNSNAGEEAKENTESIAETSSYIGDKTHSTELQSSLVLVSLLSFCEMSAQCAGRASTTENRATNLSVLTKQQWISPNSAKGPFCGNSY